MLHEAPAIPRLGIPAYNWWNEGLHGVARAGDRDRVPAGDRPGAPCGTRALLHRIADGDLRRGARQAPRVPAPGRSRALQGADVLVAEHQHLPRPALGARPRDLRRGSVPDRRAWASRSVRGLQGDDPRYLKTVATPEALRRTQRPRRAAPRLRRRRQPEGPARDLPARVRGLRHRGQGRERHGAPTTAPTASPARRARRCWASILRGEWGFDGLRRQRLLGDQATSTRATRSRRRSRSRRRWPSRRAATSNCGCSYGFICRRPSSRGCSPRRTSTSASRACFAARLRLGMFDPPERVPYASIPYEVNDCRRAPRAGPHGGARNRSCCSRTSARAAAAEGHAAASRSSARTPTTRTSCSATTSASRRAR